MQTVQRINLTNLRKCDQIWEDMTPAEKGRICQKCKSTIIDFRDLPDKEVARIHTFTEGHVCGLYREEQLHVKKPTPPKKKNIAAIYIGLLGLLSTNTGKAQTLDTTRIEQTEPDFFNENQKTKPARTPQQSPVERILISGMLKDEIGEPIIYGAIYIKGTSIGVSSGLDGKYYLDITKQVDTMTQIVLVANYVGYETLEVTADPGQIKAEGGSVIDMVFTEASFIIGFYVSEKVPWHKRAWRKVRNIFRQKS